MAASHGHGILSGDQGGEHIGAVQDRQTNPSRFLQLGVAGRHRRAHHYQGRLRGAASNGGDGRGTLLAEHPHTPAAQVLQHRVVACVGAADLVVAIRQDASDGRHADPADPNEMERLMAVELLGQGRHPSLPRG